jgi:peroxiredoxin
MKLQRLFAVLMDAAAPNTSRKLSHTDIKQLSSMQCPVTRDTLLHIALRKLSKFKTRPQEPKAAAQLDWCVSIVQQLLENQSNIFLENCKGETAYDLMKQCPVQWTIVNGRAQVSEQGDDLPKYFYNGHFPRMKVTFSQETDNANSVAKGKVINHGDEQLPSAVLSTMYMIPKYTFCDEPLSMCQIAERNRHFQFYCEQQLAHAAIEHKRVDELPELMALKPTDILFGAYFGDNSHMEIDCIVIFSYKKSMIQSILKRYKNHTEDEIKDIAISLEALLQRDTNTRRVISFPDTLSGKNAMDLVNAKTLILIAKALSTLCVDDDSIYRWERTGTGAKKRTYNIDKFTQEQVDAFNELAKHVGMSPRFFNQLEQTAAIAEQISNDVTKQSAIGLSIDEIFPDIEILTPGAEQPVLLSTYFKPTDTHETALIFQQGASHPGQWTDRDADLARWKLISNPDAGEKSVGCAAGCTGQLDNHIANTDQYQKENVRQIVIMSNKTAEQLQAIQQQKGPRFLICSLTANSREQLQELGFLGMVFDGQEYLYRNTFIIDSKRKISMTLNRSEDLPADNIKEAERTLKDVQTKKAENAQHEDNARKMSTVLNVI